MTTLPDWVLITQAFLTPMVGAAVGVVAFMQWRTAHQKLVLDLFEKRLAIYDQVMEVHDDWQAEVIPLSRVKQATRALRKIERKAQFLFGPKVTASIQELRTAMNELAPFLRQMDDAADKEKRGEIYDAAQPTEKRIKRWREDFPRVCLPYLRLDQKR
ncbi:MULTISPECIES: hypothetical protein [unclassified Ensifer]|uniref:hypothetical protein n=1 Tax=unclassified Ensifer TaxID=2633371 RepID=UPI0007094AFE|nr:MULTISPECIES: hypothetical protein [unclassified Ensifer]KQW62674.1 hypothetical protein ASD02_00640 [Ensifer sp. Root1252]KRC83494.1 hypothetical protein ASE32_00635 [Ensifer sp. Root231]KRC86600.1 hypothetical protein ASE47_17015 [Ensifer sp. Root258]